MTYYDYKVVPAPKRVKKIKGISAAPDLFALTLTEAINEVARQGWEYYCSESITVQAPGGWFKRGAIEEQVVLIFRKPREHLSPRMAGAPEVTGASPAPRMAERAMAEPPMAQGNGAAWSEPRHDEGRVTPLRTGPSLGPAERS